MLELTKEQEREIFQLATQAKLNAAWTKTTIKQYYTTELPPYIRLINANSEAIDQLADAVRKMIS